MATDIEILRSEYQPLIHSDVENAKQLANAIRDQRSLVQASEYLKELKRRKKTIESKLRPIIDEAKRPWQSLRDLMDELTEPLDRAEREILKPSIAKFEIEDEHRRAAEQKRIENEMRKQEEETRLNLAVEAEKMGDRDEAKAILETPVNPISIELEKTKADGLSFSWSYSAELIDSMALIKAVADGTVPIQAINANLLFLNQHARALKDSFNIPGVKLKKERKVAVRI